MARTVSHFKGSLQIRSVDGIYRSMNAVGYHEVIIEHPLYNMTTALMKEDEVVDILSAYRQRYSEIKKDRELRLSSSSRITENLPARR